MKVIVNGETKDLDMGTTLRDVLALVGRTGADRGVAIAVNGEVVPRDEWDARDVSAEDHIEVLSAIGGG